MGLQREGESTALGLNAGPKPASARRVGQKTVERRGAPPGLRAQELLHWPDFPRLYCIRSSASVGVELEVREADSLTGCGWALRD